MYEDNSIKKYIKFGVIGFILLIVLFNLPFLYVPVGYRGVQMRLGNTTGSIYQQGISFKVPFIEGSRNIEIRTQKEVVKASAASKDLQSVDTEVALNYSLDQNKIVNLYQTVGDDFKERIIAPVLQEAVKSVTAKYTAEELITKRNQVSSDIKSMLSEKLTPRGIVAEDFNIVNFNFSEGFDKAIEAKVRAEQDALASKNKLEQIKYEAEQRVTSAKGEAEAIRIQTEAINSQGGENYVKMEWIKAWALGGAKVPTTIMGGNTQGFLLNMDIK